MEYYFAIKKNRIIPFATVWIQAEVILSKESKSKREGQIPCHITYIWNLKHNTNEHSYEIDTDSRT